MRFQAVQLFFKLVLLLHVRQSVSILSPLKSALKNVDVAGINPATYGIDVPLNSLQLNNLKHGVQFVGLANAQDDGAEYKVYPDDIKSDEEFNKEKLGLKQHIEQTNSPISKYYNADEDEEDDEECEIDDEEEEEEEDEDEDGDGEERKRRDTKVGTKISKKKKNGKGKVGSKKSVDLTKDECFSGIYDQKTCASCYTWAMKLVTEYKLCQEYNKTVDLSVQEVVDCSNHEKNPEYGNYGCAGGHMVDVASYYEKALNGWTSDPTYPYVSKETKCKVGDSSLDHVLKPAEWSVVYHGWPTSKHKEEDIVALLDQGEPVIISMYSNEFFRHYSKGVLGAKRDEPCKCPNTVNHAVCIFGYGYDEATGVLYYKGVNTWSESWGEGGTFRIAANKNCMCMGSEVGTVEIKKLS